MQSYDHRALAVINNQVNNQGVGECNNESIQSTFEVEPAPQNSNCNGGEKGGDGNGAAHNGDSSSNNGIIDEALSLIR